MSMQHNKPRLLRQWKGWNSCEHGRLIALDMPVAKLAGCSLVYSTQLLIFQHVKMSLLGNASEHKYGSDVFGEYICRGIKG